MDYTIYITNVEGNSDNISVTGRVNGAETSAILRTRRLPPSDQQEIVLRGKLSITQAAKIPDLAQALVDAYINKPPPVEDVTGIKVTR